jgi:hypothetical protein
MCNADLLLEASLSARCVCAGSVIWKSSDLCSKSSWYASFLITSHVTISLCSCDVQSLFAVFYAFVYCIRITRIICSILL